MNAKFLFAATVVLSIVSSLALAGEDTGPTRAQVKAQYAQAAGNGGLRRNDYDYDLQDRSATARTRADVIAQMRDGGSTDKSLAGPLRSRSYNPGGTESTRPSTATRAEVRAGVLAARKDGSLRRTDYD